MGAYFNTHIETPDSEHIAVAHLGLKFAESFYFANELHHAIYQYLQANTSKDKPAVVWTCCDYDDDDGSKDNFCDYATENDDDTTTIPNVILFDYMPKHKFEFVTPNSQPALKQIAKFADQNKKHYKNMTKDTPLLAMSGYLVCKDTGEYINLDVVSEQATNASKDGKILFSPLAILTRYSYNYMGGGDEDLDEIRQRLGDNNWYGKLIYYTNAQPTEGEDITQFVLLANP